jgi:hypothetical protein
VLSRREQPEKEVVDLQPEKTTFLVIAGQKRAHGVERETFRVFVDGESS